VEQRAITALCHDLLSIVEVSARLHLPLGVVRVLVGDMADEHLVMVYRPGQAGDRPNLTLLERVLYGLHTIDWTPVVGPSDLVGSGPRCLTWSCETGASRCRGGRVPRTYDPEFRRRVVELVRAGRPARGVAAELGLAEATVYRWKAQDRIDRGVKPGTSTSERGDLAAARRRIKELETELALVKQAAKLFEEGVRPKSQVPGHR
jgi:transposase